MFGDFKPRRLLNTTLLFFVLLTVLVVSTHAGAATVTLEWDPNDPVPDGYMIYIRLQEDGYNYDAPAWIGSTSSCRLDGLVPGTTYYMVVRAYEGGLQSGDSNEISYTPAAESIEEATK